MTNRDILGNQAAEVDKGDMNLAPDDTQDGNELAMIDVLTQLVLRKRTVLVFTGAAMVLGLLFAVLSPTKFTASVRILTPRQEVSSAALMSQLSSAGASGLASLAGGGGLLKNPNDMYLGLLKTRPVGDAIINRFNLIQVFHSKSIDNARKALTARTTVTSGKEGFISIEVVDKDKKLAAAIANAYPDELRNQLQAFAHSEASQRRLFYDEELRQTKEALVAAELAFQKVEKEKGMLDLNSQAGEMIKGAATMRALIRAKEVEVHVLRSYANDQNPELILAERQLASLNQEAGGIGKQKHTSGFDDMGLADVPEASMAYLRAEHELQYQQILYDLLVKQLDAARMDEAKQAAVIQVVEPAIEPERRTSPKRSLIVLESIMIGFFLGCLVALARWTLERKLSDPEAAKSLAEFKSALFGKSSHA